MERNNETNYDVTEGVNLNKITSLMRKYQIFCFSKTHEI
jgi:hypothetical protein